MYQQIINVKTGELIGICRISDNAGIPLDPDNTDYQAYLVWLAEGNEPEPAEGAE
jgi:hypothetical protein